MMVTRDTLNAYTTPMMKKTVRTFLLVCFAASIVWCGGQTKSTELFSLNRTEPGTRVPQLERSIWVVFQDSRMNYWFGSGQNGLYRYDGTTITHFTTKDGLNHNAIRGIQEDKSGDLYFSTPVGVSVFNGERFTTLLPVRSAVDQWKRSPGDLWFNGPAGTNSVFRYDGSALYRLEFSDIRPGTYSAAHTVYSIYKDPKGNIWFGTESGGVFCFNGTALHRIVEAELGQLKDGRVPAIRSILEDSDGYLWFSNVEYQYRITKNDKASFEYERVRRVPASDRQQTTLPYYTSATTVNKELWMTAYNEGVWRFDGGKLTVQSITKNGRNIQPMSIYRDRNGVLWLGTDNDGVYVMKGKSFVKFNP